MEREGVSVARRDEDLATRTERVRDRERHGTLGCMIAQNAQMQSASLASKWEQRTSRDFLDAFEVVP